MTFRDEFRFVGPAARWIADGGDPRAVLDAIEDVVVRYDCKPAPRQSWQGANGLEMIVDPIDKVVISIRWRDEVDVPEPGPGYVEPAVPKGGGGGARHRRYGSTRELLEAAEAAGCEVDRSSAHPKITLPDGEVYTMVGTASDWRALLNCASDLRRRGIDV